MPSASLGQRILDILYSRLQYYKPHAFRRSQGWGLKRGPLEHHSVQVYWPLMCMFMADMQHDMQELIAREKRRLQRKRHAARKRLGRA